MAYASLRHHHGAKVVAPGKEKAPAAGTVAGIMKNGKCTCADGHEPCTDPEVPGHPPSECQCASPQGSCPEHVDGKSTHEDWGAEYENPQTETKWKGKVGDTNYYRSGSSSMKVSALVFTATSVLVALC